MITLGKFTLDNYEEVSCMLYDFMTDVMSHRKLNPKYFCYKEVMSWISDDKDIVLAFDNNKVIGFSMCYRDTLNGITEEVYQCEYCYVVKEKRSSRAAYLLYNNAYKYSRELGIKVSTNSRVSNSVNKMVKKHFKLQSIFETLEG